MHSYIQTRTYRWIVFLKFFSKLNVLSCKMCAIQSLFFRHIVEKYLKFLSKIYLSGNKYVNSNWLRNHSSIDLWSCHSLQDLHVSLTSLIISRVTLESTFITFSLIHKDLIAPYVANSVLNERHLVVCISLITIFLWEYLFNVLNNWALFFLNDNVSLHPLLHGQSPLLCHAVL